MNAWSTATAAWNDCRTRWRALLGVGVVWWIASTLLLAPLYAATLRLAIAGSGQSVLADQDLLFFVTSPIGVAGLVVVGVIATAIVALEFGALLTILSQPPQSPSLLAALQLLLRRSARLVGVAAKIVLKVILWLAPAVAIAAATYALLLTKYDINFYLSQRPSAFWAAAIVVAGLTAYVAVAAVKLASDWVLVLPITLFEDEAYWRVAALSRERTALHRWEVRAWIIGWAVGSFLLSAATTLAIGAAAWRIAPHWPQSITAVAIGVGLGLTLAVTIGALAHLVEIVALAAIVRRLYLRLGGVIPETLASDVGLSSGASFVTRKRLAVGVPLALLGAVTLGYVTISSVPVEDRVLVIAHRGSSLSAPCNTIAAVRAAIAEGADWVEIDVQETADGEVVVFHDSDFMKIAGLNLRIWEATAERLADIDIGSYFSADFADERVPTLRAVLDECRDKAGVLIELKYYGHDVRLEERVVEIVEEAGMENQTKFMSLKREGVAKLKTLRPDWRVGQLLSVTAGSPRRLEGDFLAVNASFANRALIQKTHRDGREIYVWTVNDPMTMSAVISRGVDGLITDVPAAARAVLAEREDMPPVSRLLVDLADRFRIAPPRAPNAILDSP